MELTHNANVAIDSRYSLVRTGLQEFAGDNLLDCEDNTVLAPDAYGRSTVLDSLHSIFNLSGIVSFTSFFCR
jgi:hypothetical protein